MRDRYLYILSLVCCLIVIGLPIVINPLSQEQKSANVAANEARSANASLQMIFGNNLIISIVALLPFVGASYMFLVLLSTGLVVASYPTVGLLIYLNPILWLELPIYALMILLSYRIGFSVYKKDFKAAFKMFRNGVLIASIVLLISAFIEMLLIKGGV